MLKETWLREDRQNFTFDGLDHPKYISQQCTASTYTEAVHHQKVLLAVFHPCLWLLKAPGCIMR